VCINLLGSVKVFPLAYIVCVHFISICQIVLLVAEVGMAQRGRVLT